MRRCVLGTRNVAALKVPCTTRISLRLLYLGVKKITCRERIAFSWISTRLGKRLLRRRKLVRGRERGVTLEIHPTTTPTQKIIHHTVYFRVHLTLTPGKLVESTKIHIDRIDPPGPKSHLQSVLFRVLVKNPKYRVAHDNEVKGSHY